MSIAMLAPPVAPPREQRFRFSGISWDEYIRLGEILAERHLRMTYDRGELEIMTVSRGHERGKKLLAKLIEVIVLEMAINVESGGSFTMDREDLERGLEGDESWWIQHEAQVRGLSKIDLEKDPPPDLALEVEVSRSALDRMGIYAAIKVPEVWRWDEKELSVWLLDENGEYARSEHSLAFPFLPVAELVRFLRMSATKGETQTMLAFRKWVLEHVAEWQGANPGGSSKKSSTSNRGEGTRRRRRPKA